MKRLLMMIALFGVLALPAAAYGLDDPLKVSDHGTTCFVTNGGTAVECQGTWTGLGSQTTLFTLTAPFGCKNNGGNFPSGQSATGSQSVDPTNGNFNFDITTNSVTKGCPDDMTPTFTTATVCAQRTPPVCMTYAVRQ